MWDSEKQQRRIWFVIIVLLYMMNWVSVASRLSSLHHGISPQGQSPQSLQVALDTEQDSQSKERAEEMNKDGGGAYKEVSEVGSRPPSCEHKCGGCIPCEAIQVPTNTDHLGVQYANYEPEGWKCKCGTSFFNP